MKLNGVKRAEKLSTGDLYIKKKNKKEYEQNKKESLIVFIMLKLHFVGGHESSAR